MLIFGEMEHKPANPAAIAIGGFDGVHTGHLSLIGAAKKYAEEHQLISMIFTFDHLTEFKQKNFIMSLEKRIQIFRNLNLDSVYLQKVTEDFMELTPEAFVKEILVERCRCAYLTVGENFRFGRDASGNSKRLKEISGAYGIQCEILPMVKAETGQTISSSLLREWIQKGKVEQANRYMAVPFQLTGEIVYGRQDGRKMGFPTANLLPSNGQLLPKFGVYAVRGKLNGKSYAGISNVGTAPTYQENKIVAETNLIGLDEEVYGQTLTVEFIKKMRDTVKYPSIEQLVQQLGRDKKQAVEILRQYENK